MDVNVTWVILVHLIPIPFSITYVLIIHGHVDRTIHKIRASFKDPNSSKTLNMIDRYYLLISKKFDGVINTQAAEICSDEAPSHMMLKEYTSAKRAEIFNC